MSFRHGSALPWIDVLALNMVVTVAWRFRTDLPVELDVTKEKTRII